jgi:hypothetical protein
MMLPCAHRTGGATPRRAADLSESRQKIDQKIDNVSGET